MKDALAEIGAIALNACLRFEDAGPEVAPRLIEILDAIATVSGVALEGAGFDQDAEILAAAKRIKAAELRGQDGTLH